METKKGGTAKLAIFGFAGLIIMIILINSFVYVYEDKNVCIKRFNKVIAVYEEAGLEFKVPFIDETVEISKKAMTYNLSPSDVLTLDKKSMTVSSYAVWKIIDPLKFLQTAVNNDEAKRRIDALVYTAVKNLISSMNQTEVISSRGQDLDKSITNSVREQMYAYGIEIVDIQIKQFDLPQDNKESVYTRMISERSQIAAQYTAEGREEANKIKNSADKDSVLLISEAKAKAEQIIGEGESAYMRTLADAYDTPERAEFFEFVRSLEALKKAMTGDKTVILPMDSPLMKWFIIK